MRIGINTMSFMWRASAKDALESLARAGYRRFEIMAQPPHFDPMMSATEAQAFARFLRDAGLTVESINLPSLDQNMGSASGEMREYSIGLYERLISIAQTVGAEAIITVTGRINHPRYPSLYNVGPACAPDGITVWTAKELQLPAAMLGLGASPTTVRKIFEPDRKMKGEMISGDEKEMAAKLIARLKEMHVL